MIDIKSFKTFIGHANRTHQRLCVWYSFNNAYAKHWDRWNKYYSPTYFALEDFDKTKGAKYKNFWSVTLASTQHGWILGTARLFDPAFHHLDKKQEKPRISFDYILTRLSDRNLSSRLRQELHEHEGVINSLKRQRDNVLAHNDSRFNDKKIEPGVESLFKWLESVILRIKESESHLNSCGSVNIEYNEMLSQCGVDEVFSTILLGEGQED